MKDPAAQIPGWYGEVPTREHGDASGSEAGACRLFLCNRGGERLVVSFAITTEMDHAELDWSATIDRLARSKGWSHLAIYAPPDSGFRDPLLASRLASLRDGGFFARFGSVTLIGASHAGGGHAALAFAPLCPGATVVAFSPNTLLDPSREQSETGLPEAGRIRSGSDLAEAIADVGRAYVLFDPFDTVDRHSVECLPADRIVRLHGFGLAQDVAVALRRLGHFDDIVAAAIEGTLSPQDFYRMIRGRKNLYIYRRAMEGYLEARGKAGLSAAFTTAFRKRSRLRRVEKQRQRHAVPPETKSSSIVRPGRVGCRYPRTLGNVWMLEDDGRRFRYLSDQYNGRVMGYEEREGVTLAQTPTLALGILAFGDGVGVPRPMAEGFEWHVVDETLEGHIPAFAARSQAVVRQRMAEGRGQALRTIIALSEAQAGITAAEALPGSVRYRTALERIRSARAVLAGWDKDFFLERIGLSLLAGAPATPFRDAVDHYARVAHEIRRDAAEAAGQASYPRIVVSQSAGSRTDGRSEVILAEGQLDIVQPALGIIVATPRYPFPLMAGMPATHDPTALVLIDELESLAVDEVMAGRRWFCPSLREAQVEGRKVIAMFSAMGDLTLDPGFHGFALLGCCNCPEITGVDVKGRSVVLTLDAPPEGDDVFLAYAWGAEAQGTDDMPANAGTLRETWVRPSLAAPGRHLHRHALSGRVRLTRADRSPRRKVSP
jgi:hypothetical protein